MNNGIASTLGPNFSYSDILTTKLFSEVILCNKIKDVFENVANDRSEFGVIPIENLLFGSVRETIMSFAKFNLNITQALDFKIEHCLAAQKDTFDTIVSHPQALAQCSQITEDKSTIECSSTSKAMGLAKMNSNFAAIGSVECAKKNALQIIKRNVGNSEYNITRFIVISKKKSDGKKTSLLISSKTDRPGLLFQILAPFSAQGINLTKIESIPTGNKIGEYIFYIEVSASNNDIPLKAVINFLETNMNVVNLGSYEVTNDIQ